MLTIVRCSEQSSTADLSRFDIQDKIKELAKELQDIGIDLEYSCNPYSELIEFLNYNNQLSAVAARLNVLLEQLKTRV